jgi:hypothetical protein
MPAAGYLMMTLPRTLSNIDPDEEAALKKLAATLLILTPAALTQVQTDGEITEVNGHA